MAEDHNRASQRQTFDQAAALYQRARPEYPRELFDHLIDVTGLAAGDSVLEVGCGSGKATLPLARRGFRLTCIELGAELAAAARGNLSDFPDVTVMHSSFEEWIPPKNADFRAVVAATAWHWIDPELRYRKAPP